MVPKPILLPTDALESEERVISNPFCHSKPSESISRYVLPKAGAKCAPVTKR